MAGIRPFEDDDSEDEERRVCLRRDWEMLEIFATRTFNQMFGQVMERNIRPLISSIVKQELDKAKAEGTFLAILNQNSASGSHSLQSSSFKLKFLNKLSLPVFTGRHIKGEDGNPLRVALVDGITDKPVICGTEASAKVEIVVVEGDFDSDKRSDWMLEEFNKKIATGEDGRKSLLTGQMYLNLKEGIGFVGEISFTHNRNWKKKCEYRLAAKFADSGNRVREAITESFVLMDYRNTYKEKHHPPSQRDEVYRLVGIQRGGAFHNRLEREKIKTVKDFLTHYYQNPQRLQDILGTTMTAKQWEATVDHAQTCVLDKKLLLYHPKEKGVVFNVVWQVMGLISEGCYFPIDKLSEAEKTDARNLVVSAIDNMEQVRSFDDETSMHARLQLPFHTEGVQPSTSFHTNVVSFDEGSHMPDSLPLSDAACPANSPSFTNFNFSFETHLDDGYVQSSTSYLGSSSLMSVGSTSNINEYAFPSVENEDHKNNLPLSFPENPNFAEEENFFDIGRLLRNPSMESQDDLQSIVNSFLLARSEAAQRSWMMLFKKWRMVKWMITPVKCVSSEMVHAPKRPRIC